MANLVIFEDKLSLNKVRESEIYFTVFILKKKKFNLLRELIWFFFFPIVYLKKKNVVF